MAFERATLNLTWTVRRDPVAGVWHDPMDFVRHAARHLMGAFDHYNAAFDLDEIAQRGDAVVIKMTFAVDLDMVPGAFHQPEDHAVYAQRWLHEEVSTYSRSLDITHSVSPVSRAA